MELAENRGFYRVTMDELAAESGISKRTLYRYFRSKDGIIEATLEKCMGDIASHIEEFATDHHKPEEIVKHLLHILHEVGQTILNPLVLNDLRRHYPHYWKKIDEFRMKKTQKVIQSKFFLDERNKAYIRNLNPRIVTTAVLASIQAVANPEFIVSNGLTAEETLTQLMEFFLYGIMKKES